MRKEVRRRHDAHVRASAVCTEHSTIFDATPGGQKARAMLGTCVADTDRLLAFQQRSLEDRRAATEQLRQWRRTLRDAVKAVVVVGRLVNLLGDTAMGTMRQPGPVSDDELLAYARGLLDRVAPHADAFVAAGLPPDLLKNLSDAVERFAATKDAQAGSRQRFTAAAESIRETQDKADKTVAALEAIAVNTPAASPEVLTKLRIAKRVGPRTTEQPTTKRAPRLTPPSSPPPADKAA